MTKGIPEFNALKYFFWALVTVILSWEQTCLIDHLRVVEDRSLFPLLHTVVGSIQALQHAFKSIVKWFSARLQGGHNLESHYQSQGIFYDIKLLLDKKGAMKMYSKENIKFIWGNLTTELHFLSILYVWLFHFHGILLKNVLALGIENQIVCFILLVILSLFLGGSVVNIILLI